MSRDIPAQGGSIAVETLSTAWIIVCAVLVLLMQPGFACLEAGLVRRRHASGVALKNLADLCVSCLVFVALGSQLMFGSTMGGFVGRPSLTAELIAPEQFLYFAALGAVAATIVSGAIAERVNLAAYLVITILVAGLVGHWAWSEGGWLANRAFSDIAGSTVIHSVAGWTAFGAVLAVGPRLGAIERGKRVAQHANPSMAVMGVLVLWVGWLGLHGGSGLRFDDSVASAVLATLLAGAAGGTTAILVSLRLPTSEARVTYLVGGVIAGLVSVSGAVTLLTMRSAIVVAAVGGLIYVVGSRVLERLGIDDAVGAIPAHLFAGIWGTLAVALPAPFGGVAPGTDILPALATQAVGAAAVGLIALPLGFIVTKLVSRVSAVAVVHETGGMPVKIEMPKQSMSEDWNKLAHALDQSASPRNSIRPLQVEVSGETEVFAKLYNQVALWLRASKDEMEHLRSATGRDPLTGLYNRATFLDYLEKALATCKRTEEHGAVLFIDMDGFKPVNDHWGHSAGDRVLREVAIRMRDCLRESDVIARVGGDEFCILVELLHETSYAEIVAKKILAIFDEAFVIDSLELMLGASIGIASFSPDHNESAGSIIKSADQAMYQAKAKGKGQYCVFRGDDAEYKRPPAVDAPTVEAPTDEANVAIFPPPKPGDKTETG